MGNKMNPQTPPGWLNGWKTSVILGRRHRHRGSFWMDSRGWNWTIDPISQPMKKWHEMKALSAFAALLLAIFGSSTVSAESLREQNPISSSHIEMTASKIASRFDRTAAGENLCFALLQQSALIYIEEIDGNWSDLVSFLPAIVNICDRLSDDSVEYDKIISEIAERDRVTKDEIRDLFEKSKETSLKYIMQKHPDLLKKYPFKP